MKNYHHGNLKEELISCAFDMCERDGYTNLSIRSLAKESKLSKTAPYSHCKTKKDLYAAVAHQGFKKLNKEMYSIKAKNPKKYLVSCGKSYIHFGLKNANTYDLMFGTAVGSFIDYPELRESANKLFTLLQSSFSKASKDSEEVIAFKCITLWSMAHGLVGIIRKVKIAGNLNEYSIGPMSFAGEIANNLDAHLDKVVTGIKEN